MTRLHHNRNWKIEVFGREHGIPHFHLRWPDGRASIAIETLEVIIGNPPAIILAEVRQWAVINRQQLWAAWHKLNGGKPA
ncbi:MAG: DUF4160 domain-containing protein [Deltaproteobacteria bacterium]|nr:DUF4160 domain-containing protein [Deltaproteobacteria bacterium]